MHPIGMIALDFDGTLLRSDETISDRTNAALAAAARQGWLVVGATGRPTVLADAVSRQVPSMTHVVSNNGSLTMDVRSNVMLQEIICPQQEALWAISAVRETVVDAGITIDHAAGGQTWESGFDLLVSSPPLGAMVEDAAATVSGDVRKILAFSPSLSANELVETLGPVLAPRLSVTFSGLAFVDIGPPGISKASALAALVEDLGVPVDRTFAFGDARNDHEMLEWASTGVAMGNAFDETKAVAHEVTATNDDDGVAVFVERLLG